jgi:hypothetical protein
MGAVQGEGGSARWSCVWEEQGSYIAAEKTGIITTEEHRGLLLLQGEQENIAS